MSDPNSLAEAANRLSLAAVLLGGSAFVIAFLQALLQYVTASEDRIKCNFSAIDISEKRKRWLFSPLHWKTKFYYPELEISLENIKKQRNSEQKKDQIYFDLILEKIKEQINFDRGRPVGGEGDVEKGGVKEGDVKEGDVKEEEKEEEEEEKEEEDEEEEDEEEGGTKSPPSEPRPRATWAQLLITFNLRDTKELFKQHVDASAIPRVLDVPVQRIRLFELGRIAMFLGFTEIEIKIKERQFTATGPFAAITTVDFDNFGKVLRFEGDPFRIRSQLPKHSYYFKPDAPQNFVGELSIGDFVTKRSNVPLKVYLKIIEESPKIIEKDPEIMEEYLQDGHEKVDDWAKNHVTFEETQGNLVEEASCFEEEWIKGLRRLNTRNQDGSVWGETKNYDLKGPTQDILKSVIRSWQKRNYSTIPTIFALGCFAGIPSVFSGFPGKFLILPFMGTARVIAENLTQCGSETFKISKLLQQELTCGRIGHVNEVSAMGLSKGNIGLDDLGVVSWGFSPVEKIFNVLPRKLQEDILGSKREPMSPKESDSKEEKPNFMKDMLKFMKDLLKFMKNKLTSSKEKPKSKGNESKSKEAKLNFRRDLMKEGAIQPDDITILLMPGAHVMLKEFQPREWIAAMDSRDLSTKALSWTPQALIWCQLTIIDLSIYLLILGCYSDAKMSIEDKLDPSKLKMRKKRALWKTYEKKILRSIIKSWEMTEEKAKDKRDTPYEWDLVSALKEHSGLPTEGEWAEKRLKKLSDALMLRCLFYIAFLMMNPDSSDVFLARHSEVEMPMI